MKAQLVKPKKAAVVMYWPSWNVTP